MGELEKKISYILGPVEEFLRCLGARTNKFEIDGLKRAIDARISEIVQAEGVSDGSRSD